MLGQTHYLTDPTNDVPIRVFESYDSYDRFMPLIYRYWDQMGFASFCYQDLENSDWMPEVNGICRNLGFPGAITMTEGVLSHSLDSMMNWQMSSVNVWYDEWLDIWEFNEHSNEDCNSHRSVVVVECMASGSDQDCLSEGNQCATDLDCCDQMFCSSISGNCTDPVECSYLLCFQKVKSKCTHGSLSHNVGHRTEKEFIQWMYIECMSVSVLPILSSKTSEFYQCF